MTLNPGELLTARLLAAAAALPSAAGTHLIPMGVPSFAELAL